jgi:hypothetical protein
MTDLVERRSELEFVVANGPATGTPHGAAFAVRGSRGRTR